MLLIFYFARLLQACNILERSVAGDGMPSRVVSALNWAVATRGLNTHRNVKERRCGPPGPDRPASLRRARRRRRRTIKEPLSFPSSRCFALPRAGSASPSERNRNRTERNDGRVGSGASGAAQRSVRCMPPEWGTSERRRRGGDERLLRDTGLAGEREGGTASLVGEGHWPIPPRAAAAAPRCCRRAALRDASLGADDTVLQGHLPAPSRPPAPPDRGRETLVAGRPATGSPGQWHPRKWRYTQIPCILPRTRWGLLSDLGLKKATCLVPRAQIQRSPFLKKGNKMQPIFSALIFISLCT